MSVVHDVFVGMAKALRSYEGRGSFEAWLRQIAARVALMKLRRRKMMSEVDLNESMTSVSGRASTVLDQIDLRDALNRLPVQQRVVIVLKDRGDGGHHRPRFEGPALPCPRNAARAFANGRRLVAVRLRRTPCRTVVPSPGPADP